MPLMETALKPTEAGSSFKKNCPDPVNNLDP